MPGNIIKKRKLEYFIDLLSNIHSLKLAITLREGRYLTTLRNYHHSQAYIIIETFVIKIFQRLRFVPRLAM